MLCKDRLDFLKKAMYVVTNIDQLGEAEAVRAKALAQLARLRGVSMTTLMRDLGIRPPNYV